MIGHVSEIAMEVNNRSFGKLIGFKVEGGQLFAIQTGITNQFGMQADAVRVDI